MKLVENNSFEAAVEITHVLTVPVSADEKLKQEQESLVGFYNRTCGRSSETVDLEIRTVMTLETVSYTHLLCVFGAGIFDQTKSKRNISLRSIGKEPARIGR